jgi:predicted cytidylate kinase
MTQKYNKITISGKICTGKTTLYKNLQHTLGWPAYSAGHFFRKYSKEHGLVLASADEQNEDITKRVDFGMHEKLLKDKHIILEGWMSGIMAQGISDVLRILLVCNDRVRIKRFKEREKITEEEASKNIFARETNVFQKLSEIYYRKDFTNPVNYDLVIDTNDISKEEILKKVLDQL